MNIEITHNQDPLMGWDVSVKVAAEGTEKIAGVAVYVNMIRVVSVDFDPALSVYTKEMERVGQFPGENVVQVVVRDQNNVETSGEDSW